MEGEFVPYTASLHGFWKMFAFLVWYELGNIYSTSFHIVQFTENLSMKYLQRIFI